MDDFYYEQQRLDDIVSLQSMFGPPWTPELLAAVLDFYDGDVEETVSKLLVLNSHHKGNPAPF